MIKIIIKASKVSKRNMNKSLSIVKKFMKMLKIVFLKILTDREKKWFLGRIFFVVWGNFQVWSSYLLIF